MLGGQLLSLSADNRWSGTSRFIKSFRSEQIYFSWLCLLIGNKMLHVTNGIRALTKSFKSGAICFFMFVTLMVFNMLQLTNDLSEHHRLIESFTSREIYFSCLWVLVIIIIRCYIKPFFSASSCGSKMEYDNSCLILMPKIDDSLLINGNLLIMEASHHTLLYIFLGLWDTNTSVPFYRLSDIPLALSKKKAWSLSNV